MSPVALGSRMYIAVGLEEVGAVLEAEDVRPFEDDLVVPDAVGVASVGAGLLVTSLINELTSLSGVGGALTLGRGIWMSGWRAIFGRKAFAFGCGLWGGLIIYGWRRLARARQEFVNCRQMTAEAGKKCLQSGDRRGNLTGLFPFFLRVPFSSVDPWRYPTPFRMCRCVHPSGLPAWLRRLVGRKRQRRRRRQRRPICRSSGCSSSKLSDWRASSSGTSLRSEAFFQITALAAIGFAIQYFLPLAVRSGFFLCLSLASILLVLGFDAGTWLIALGLGLIVIVHLPISMTARILFVLVAGGLLAALRAGWAAVPGRRRSGRSWARCSCSG